MEYNPDLNDSEYKWSLFYLDHFLGEHITFESAQEEISNWISECEDTNAKDPQNYFILPYGEYP